jgi:hypothetical protein
MKIYQVLSILLLSASCRKEQLPEKGNITNTLLVRKVRYELYTYENFSGNAENIQFSLFMRNAGKTIFDSALAIMKVEDIPDFSHRIIIEKTVPLHDTSSLSVGFDYRIENVGISWYQEIFPAADTLKLIQYSFR